MKAILKPKNELKDDGESSESVEEDYPHIKLEDLLSELKIRDDKEEEVAEEEEDDWEDEGVEII
jgi:hypothetical protein